MRGLRLTVGQLAPDVVCVGLTGELDISRALLLDEELRAAEATEPRALVIDISRLSFVDSRGLAGLLAARRRAQRGGWRLMLVEGSGAVGRLLSMAALDWAFQTIDAPEDALAVLAA